MNSDWIQCISHRCVDRISRLERSVSSPFHFFGSQFYTQFDKNGYKGVETWTKKIKLFEKKLVFIPIIKGYHWSLLVLVNPGAVTDIHDFDENEKKKAPLSCLIFMDSLKMHNANTVAKNIRKWLNEEWNKQRRDDQATSPFTKESFPKFTPKGMLNDYIFLGTNILSPYFHLTFPVPTQDNSFDCGVFVCRYASAIYQLRERNFTYGLQPRQSHLCLVLVPDGSSAGHYGCLLLKNSMKLACIQVSSTGNDTGH